MKSEKNILQTKDAFEELYNRSLSKKELFLIKQNLRGFFETLIRIELNNKQEGIDVKH